MPTQQIDKSVEHFLLPFITFMNLNPRAMKRLANAYTTYRDIALICHIDIIPAEKRIKLVFWCILALEAPLLLEFLEKNPQHIRCLQAGEKPSESVEPAIAEIFRERRLTKMFTEGFKDVRLDESTIRMLARLRG